MRDNDTLMVTAVDSDNKTVTYDKDNEKIVIDYDKLVFAIGGNPFRPPMDGLDLKSGRKFFYFYFFNAKQKLRFVVGCGMFFVVIFYLGLLCLNSATNNCLTHQ